MMYDTLCNGGEYNSFSSSYSDTDFISTFIYVMNSYTEPDPVIFKEVCDTLFPMATKLPMNKRIEAAVKREFLDYYLGYDFTLTYGERLIDIPATLDPGAYSTTVPLTATTTTIQTAVIATHTLTSHHESGDTIVDGSMTSVLSITSNNTPMINCAVAGLARRYYDSNGTFDALLSAHSHAHHVSSYSALLDKYPNENIAADGTKWQEVMIGLYSFIFKLPPDMKNNILDVIGYCYLENQRWFRNKSSVALTDYYLPLTGYSSGAGSDFHSIFKFGNGSTYLEFVTMTKSSFTYFSDYGQTDSAVGVTFTITNSIFEVTNLANPYDPIFPTQFIGAGGNITGKDYVPVVDLRQGAGSNTGFKMHD
ncbi:unnamed protein product [Ambrosiozyma monospora]|uniref:Unnamed protein product n=1 Tax=Ambrosiozyma monospora TaxID=43982 RepID=A0ACB5SWW2_AMBMO|nr:unnamed protein product [Ambrosiozyma monospora]